MDAARPVDRVVAAYALVSGAALAFPHRPASWPLLALAHLTLAALALRPGPLKPLLSRVGTAFPRAARIGADWYPLALIPLLYAELSVLNVAVWDGRYFDGLVQGWEETVFGHQPAVTLASRAPSLLLSEALHAAYLSYYPIIYVPPLVLYLRGRREAFRSTVHALMLTFVVHYVVFVYFPVQGPRYLFPSPDGAIAAGPFYRLSHLILEAGSSQGAAFPSSHMAVAAAQTVAVFRFLPRAAPILVAASVGLGVGAVYGGFHYAIDMVVGAVVGLGIALAVGRPGKVASADPRARAVDGPPSREQPYRS